MAKRKINKRPRGRGPVRRRRKSPARAVEAALAGIAHDIRTPLTGMVALAGFLDDLKRRGVIADWHPGRWDNYLKQRITILFESPADADAALGNWGKRPQAA